VRPLPLAVAVVLAVVLALRARRGGRLERVVLVALVAGSGLYGLGVIPKPDFEEILLDLGEALGAWTYLLVGGLAFLETGAFIGLVAPGETAVVAGGVFGRPGQGRRRQAAPARLGVLHRGRQRALRLGRKLGRGGFTPAPRPRLKITPGAAREVSVRLLRPPRRHDDLVGRFIGLVRRWRRSWRARRRCRTARFLPSDVVGLRPVGRAAFACSATSRWRNIDRADVDRLGIRLAMRSSIVFLGVGSLVRHGGASIAHTRAARGGPEVAAGTDASRRCGMMGREHTSHHVRRGRACGVFALAAFAAWILVPAWTAYSRWWERIARGVPLAVRARAPWSASGCSAAARSSGSGTASAAEAPTALPSGACPRPRRDEAGLDLGRSTRSPRPSSRGGPAGGGARAAARALDASLVLVDRAGQVLAVAARSPADERSLMGDAGTSTSGAAGRRRARGPLRMRLRGPPARLAAVVRRSSRRRSSACARPSARRARRSRLPARVLARGFDARGSSAAPRRIGSSSRGRQQSSSPRARPRRDEDGWRSRSCHRRARGRGARARSVAALRERAERSARRSSSLVPGRRGGRAGRRRACCASCARRCRATPSRVGRSRVARDPLARPRRQRGAARGERRRGRRDRPALAFEETGAYRLLLPAMSEDPAELQRFYAETVEPLVVYDEQYATDLVQTVEAFLDADGNVAGTAREALHAPPHDPVPARARARAVGARRRLDRRAREAQLGLKAMRVLGIAAPGSPARDAPRER
jgi:hypothetical protein